MIRRVLALLVVLALALPSAPAPAATGTIAPFPLHQFFNNSGAPCASCRLFTYSAGTSTKVSVYTDVGLSVAHSNPITLSSAGRPSSGIFLSPGISYKFVLASSGSDDPPASPIWTQDNVFSVPPADIEMDVTGTAGEALTAGDVVAMADGSSGSIAGRWYKADADSAYLSTTSNALGMMPADLASGSSGSIRLLGRVTGLSGLTAGTVYYASATAGALTSSAPANARAICVADSTTSVIVSQWIPLPDASATVAGKVSTGTQTMAGAKTWSGAATFSSSTPAVFDVTPTAKPGAAATARALSGRVFSDTTSRAGINGTTDLSSHSLEAATLNSNGQAIRVKAWGTFAANANSKRVFLDFGATTIADTTASTSWNNYVWHIEATVMRTGAATQEAEGVCDVGAEAATTINGMILITSPTETLSGAVTVRTRATGAAASDVVQSGFIIEFIGG